MPTARTARPTSSSKPPHIANPGLARYDVSTLVHRVFVIVVMEPLTNSVAVPVPFVNVVEELERTTTVPMNAAKNNVPDAMMHATARIMRKLVSFAKSLPIVECQHSLLKLAQEVPSLGSKAHANA